MQRTSLAIIAIVIIVIAAVAGYYYLTLPPPEVPEKVLKIGAPLSDLVLDPHLAYSGTEARIDSHMIEALLTVYYDAQGEIAVFEPLLALSWDVVDDVTVDFNLRQGVKFHSGREMTADDVVYSFERYQRLGPFAAAIMGGMYTANFTALDKYTVRFELEDPYAPLTKKIATMGWLGIYDSVQAEELGDEGFGNNPSGTGPYKFVEKIEGEKVVMERFEDYWGEQPQADKIEWIMIPDNVARATALETGEVHAILNCPPTDAQRLRDAGIEVITWPSTRPIQLIINGGKPPFNDVRVRQAMNYAVDRVTIAATVYDGFTEASTCAAITKASWGYKDQTPFYPYDPDKARQLLAEADVGDVEVKIWTSGRYSMERELTEAVAGYLQDVGFTVNIIQMDWPTLTSQLYAELAAVLDGTKEYADYDLVYYNCGLVVGDPDHCLYVWYRTGTPQNFYFYYDSHLDDLFHQARINYDEEVRRPLYHEGLDILYDEAVALFLVTEPTIAAHSPDLQNVRVPVGDTPYYADAYLSDW